MGVAPTPAAGTALVHSGERTGTDCPARFQAPLAAPAALAAAIPSAMACVSMPP